MEYKEYKNNKLDNQTLTKTLEFNPKQYFEEKEKTNTIKALRELYIVNIEDIFNEKGEL